MFGKSFIQIFSLLAAAATLSQALTPLLTREKFEAIKNAPKNKAVGKDDSPFEYHGGPLMVNGINLYVIFYGKFADITQNIIIDFLAEIGQSPWWSVMQQYTDGNGNAVSPSAPLVAAAVDNYSQGNHISDVSQVIKNFLSSFGLSEDPNGHYVVAMAEDVTADTICAGACGYHTAYNGDSGHVIYSLIGNTAACRDNNGFYNCLAGQFQNGAPTPNGDFVGDGMVSVIAHELAEAATDPLPFSGWADGKNNECGDLCAWQFDPVIDNGVDPVYNAAFPSANYLIQNIWSPVTSSCVQSP